MMVDRLPSRVVDLDHHPVRQSRRHVVARLAIALWLGRFRFQCTARHTQQTANSYIKPTDRNKAGCQRGFGQRLRKINSKQQR